MILSNISGDKERTLMADAFVTVEKLHKNFNDHVAVKDISFSIYQGEIFGLLGPNGAGKTTTIRILSTVLKADRGEVTIGGYSVSHNADDVHRLIGVCPQELALYEDLSALDNLLFFGRMVGLSSSRARAQAMENLELMGLTERAKGKVKKFSGGMKRRINLAIALMGEPRLIFLDEPTVGIDPQSRNNIYETIESLRDRGMTVLYTTHYMEEAERLCDRVAIMDGGEIIAMDTPFNLKSQIGPPEQVTLEDVFLKMTGRGLRD
jgi:ABC-2 type transport system ATP-binding protein